MAVLQLLGKYTNVDDVYVDDMLQDLPMAIFSGDKNKNKKHKILLCVMYSRK